MTTASKSAITVSLIVATVGRVDELDRLLRSIAAQSLPGVEVIVVDQNTDDRVSELLRQVPPELRPTYVRSPRGLSRARNAGLALASGAILGFPDDDCWYPNDFLQQVKEWFNQHADYHFVCAALRDEAGCEVAARWPSGSRRLDRRSALRAAASASLFMRREMVRQLGGFDEQMGLGADTPFQSGEDTDLALRALQANGKGWFEKSLYACHPRRDPAQVSSDRAFSYGLGFGYTLGKHQYPALWVAYHVMRALGGMFKSLWLLRTAQAAFYFHSARGRWQGYSAFALPGLPPKPALNSAEVRE